MTSKRRGIEGEKPEENMTPPIFLFSLFLKVKE
jgi:hypothetical protein